MHHFRGGFGLLRFPNDAVDLSLFGELYLEIDFVDVSIDVLKNLFLHLFQHILRLGKRMGHASGIMDVKDSSLLDPL